MNVFHLGLSFLLVAGCGKPAATCLDASSCGDHQICEAEACRTVECVASADCAVHEYCDDGSHACVAGCMDAGDCFAGESCADSNHACFADKCRSTLLDCGLGETCNTTTGACEDASACDPCIGGIVGECGAGTCNEFASGELTGNYCVLPCATVGAADQCPRGLECRDLSGLGDLYCYADCPVFDAERKQDAAQ